MLLPTPVFCNVYDKVLFLMLVWMNIFPRRNQIDLACEVLKTLLNVLDPSNILSQYGVQLVRALKHPNVEVKQLVLLEVLNDGF